LKFITKPGDDHGTYRFNSIVSSTGARRWDACVNRLSLRSSIPSFSYLWIYLRNVLSQTPSNCAVSARVYRPPCQLPSASAQCIFKISCSTTVRLIGNHLLDTNFKTGQMMCYKSGHCTCCRQRAKKNWLRQKKSTI